MADPGDGRRCPWRSSSSRHCSGGCGAAGPVPQTVFTDRLRGRRPGFIQGWRGHNRPAAHVATWRRVVATHVVWLASCRRRWASTWSATSYVARTTCSPSSARGRAVTRHDRRLPHRSRRIVSYLDFVVVKSGLLPLPLPLRPLPGRALRPRHPGDRLRRSDAASPGESAAWSEGDCVDCGLCVQRLPHRDRHPRRACRWSASPAPSASTPVTA